MMDPIWLKSNGDELVARRVAETRQVRDALADAGVKDPRLVDAALARLRTTGRVGSTSIGDVFVRFPDGYRDGNGHAGAGTWTLSSGIAEWLAHDDGRQFLYDNSNPGRPANLEEQEAERQRHREAAHAANEERTRQFSEALFGAVTGRPSGDKR